MRWANSEFFVGAHLAWQRYGGEFGASAWSPDGGVGEPARRLHLREVLAPLSGSGISVIRCAGPWAAHLHSPEACRRRVWTT